jgi:hypothetical protein
MSKREEPKCKNCGVPIYDGRPYYSNGDGTFQCARLTDCYAKEHGPKQEGDV